MAEFNEITLTDAVIDRFQQADSPRFRELISVTIRHLHELVREVNLTPQEWFSVIEFLTATGQKCDDKRQEFILLSDVLGVSMMMEMVNNRRLSGETEATVLGPFHNDKAPKKKFGEEITEIKDGQEAIISGKVIDNEGQPIVGAQLDIWQAGPDGMYDVQKGETVDLRGIFTTNKLGEYSIKTVKPEFYPVPTDGPVGHLLKTANRHPFRPAHVHFMIKAEGFQTLVTHLFVRGDNYLDSDAVFAVRDSLVIDFKANEHGGVAAHFDFVLARN